jgi:hypothetical protein
METRGTSLNYSQRLIRKGVLVEETYRIFSVWDVRRSLQGNIRRTRAENPIGAKNHAWLHEVTATISNRFSSGEPFDALVTLTKGGLAVEKWKYCLLWHLGSTDGLYAAFCSEFLFPRVESGVAVFTTNDVVPFVAELQSRSVFKERLSDYGVRRLGRDLLRAAAEFGFVQGRTRREVRHPALPEDAVLYAIYSLRDAGHTAQAIVSAPRWRMFLMSPSHVEHELLNMHQFRRLRYERAGSIKELSLPHDSLLEFANSLVT